MSILSRIREFFNRPVLGPNPWVNETVTVRKGDTLWHLAHDHLDNESRWREIYNLNRAQIGPDPDKIKPGMILMLPRKDRS